MEQTPAQYLRSIADALADHPDHGRGNSKVAFAWHKARGGLERCSQLDPIVRDAMATIEQAATVFGYLAQRAESAADRGRFRSHEHAALGVLERMKSVAVEELPCQQH